MPLKSDSKDHFALTYRYLQVLAVELRAALHREGMDDPAAQQRVLESFLFSVAMSWDGGCIKDPASRKGAWHPTPCFRDTKEVGESSVLVVPDGEDAFHETAVFGAVEDSIAVDDPERDWKFTYNNMKAAELLSTRLSDGSSDGDGHGPAEG